MSIERGSDYYDNYYKDSIEYRLPPEESVYFNLWKKVLRLTPSGVSVTELGCGSGQFAQLLAKKVSNYRGIDFSKEAIKICPQIDGFQFDCMDVKRLKFEPSFFIALEIFEHTDDYQILKNIGLGSEIIFTVPDFDQPSHVRYFHSVNEVVGRYKNVVRFEHVSKCDRWFICKGVTI